MSSPRFANALERVTRLRRRLELERRGSGSSWPRLLKLQLLILKAERRLAELLVPTGARPIPVPLVAGRRASRSPIVN